MTYKTYTTKTFINSFNFADPDWNTLPTGFPDISKKGLIREECHLLDGIKLAYFVEKSWKKGVRQAVYISSICLIGLISLIGFINLIRLASHNQELTKPVQAATIKVNEAIESTMSAILKRKEYLQK